MTNLVARSVIGLVFVSGVLCSAQAHAGTAVDVSLNGIFTAVSDSRDMQATVDTLTANGAQPSTIVSIAAAAGVPMETMKNVSVCTNNMTPENGPMSLTCMKLNSLTVAYQTGMNDRLNYMPATAAGITKAKK